MFIASLFIVAKNWRMDKNTVATPYNVIIFSNKKEKSTPHTCNNMVESQIHDAK